MEMVTLREFWKTRRQRSEKFSTIIVVAGITFCVVVYDLCAKTSHEVWISTENFDGNKNIAIRIPEIHICEKNNIADSIKEAVEKVFQLQAQPV